MYANIGVHDARYVLLENDTRLLITISFDNDFDKYFDDALAILTGGDPNSAGFEIVRRPFHCQVSLRRHSAHFGNSGNRIQMAFCSSQETEGPLHPTKSWSMGFGQCSISWLSPLWAPCIPTHSHEFASRHRRNPEGCSGTVAARGSPRDSWGLCPRSRGCSPRSSRESSLGRVPKCSKGERRNEVYSVASRQSALGSIPSARSKSKMLRVCLVFHFSGHIHFSAAAQPPELQSYIDSHGDSFNA
jgi:hypothetical protein